MRELFVRQLALSFCLCLLAHLLTQTAAAPVEEWVDDASQRTGCYYQFQHYTEGEQVGNKFQVFPISCSGSCRVLMYLDKIRVHFSFTWFSLNVFGLELTIKSLVY